MIAYYRNEYGETIYVTHSPGLYERRARLILRCAECDEHVTVYPKFIKHNRQGPCSLRRKSSRVDRVLNEMMLITGDRYEYVDGVFQRVNPDLTS